MDVISFVKSFHPKKTTALFVFSGLFFLVFMSLDFFTTTYVAQGDISMEGNALAALWWKVTGQFHHIDVPIWIGYVFAIAWIFNMKSEFVALWWLNGIGFGHFLGWSTWLPNGSIDHLYKPITLFLPAEWAYMIPLGAFGMFFGLLMAYLEIKLREWYRLL